MHPASSSSSAAHPPDGDRANPKAPPPPGPAMGYPANAAPNPNNASSAYYAAAPPPVANGNGTAAFGVAYPYPAPPPHHHPHHHHPPPPPSYHHYHNHHNPYQAAPPPPPTCLRRLLALVVAAFLLLGAGTFIVWLLLRPRAPAFSLSSLTLSRVAYSPANSSLSAAFDASLLADNPNSKLTISYSSLVAYVDLAPSSPIAVTSLAPFAQGPRNATTLAFRLDVDGTYVGPDEAAALKSGNGGTMEVQVRLAAIAVFDRGGWRTRRRAMRVLCDGVPVTFRGKNATDAKFDGPARRCQVVL
ncbi:Harpin-induced protein 1 containing protein [Hordeum vulgare]|uniref:Late embryogenesis abundant protein LEA-2 subgroup domain-containing protein n=2 Tax=Hordeum vulgare subsp. vulgare TaxID=112509 RepID=A0A8I6XAT7_HORVV|nr:atrophin-1-like [Hordeum vulgare subsp. vulgare]KAE8778715.1 Harpin-induced protein 1 containing protein [Hordeum vulgare]